MTTTPEALREIWIRAKRQPTHPSDIAELLDGVNVRYARELIGLLHREGFLDENENGEFEANPHQSEFEFNQFVAANTPKEESMPTPTKSKASPAKPKPKTSSGEIRKCLCGCGENVAGKASYRPGHDARHAGQIARAMLAASKKTDRTKALDALPSPALQAKATKIFEGLQAKTKGK